MNTRTSMAQRDEIIRRTVYVSDIDHQVSVNFASVIFGFSCFLSLSLVFPLGKLNTNMYLNLIYFLPLLPFFL